MHVYIDSNDIAFYAFRICCIAPIVSILFGLLIWKVWKKLGLKYLRPTNETHYYNFKLCRVLVAFLGLGAVTYATWPYIPRATSALASYSKHGDVSVLSY
jgi:hypothetical protein